MTFVLDFESNSRIFNDYFVLQSTLVDAGSEVPSQLLSNAAPLTEFWISEEDSIRSLNPSKAYGWNDMSIHFV